MASELQFASNRSHQSHPQFSALYSNPQLSYDRIRLNQDFLPYQTLNRSSNSLIQEKVGKKFKINKRITYHSNRKRKTDESSLFDHDHQNKSHSKRIINPSLFKESPCVGAYDISCQKLKKRIIKNIQLETLKETKRFNCQSLNTQHIYQINFNSIRPKQNFVDLSKQLSRKLQFMQKSKTKLSECDEIFFPNLRQKNLQLQMPLNCLELDNLFKSTMQLIFDAAINTKQRSASKKTLSFEDRPHSSKMINSLIFQVGYLYLLIFSCKYQFMQSKEYFSMICIYLRLHNGNGCLIKLSNKSTILEMLSLACQRNFELPPKCNIIFKGQLITNHQEPLCNLNIRNNSIIHVESFTDYAREINIDVSIYYNFQKFIVNESSKSTIGNLKLGIYKLLKIQPKDQQLIFQGSKLQNDKNLQFYKITNDSLLCLLTQRENQIEQSLQKDGGEYLPMVFVQNQLIDSVSSLREQFISSKMGMFRSVNIAKKKVEEQRVEVTHQQKPSAVELQSNQCYLNLFRKQDGQLKAPVLHASDLFASLENGNQDDKLDNKEDENDVTRQDNKDSKKGKLQIILTQSITEDDLRLLLWKRLNN